MLPEPFVESKPIPVAIRSVPRVQYNQFMSPLLFDLNVEHLKPWNGENYVPLEALENNGDV